MPPEVDLLKIFAALGTSGLLLYLIYVVIVKITPSQIADERKSRDANAAAERESRERIISKFTETIEKSVENFTTEIRTSRTDFARERELDRDSRHDATNALNGMAMALVTSGLRLSPIRIGDTHSTVAIIPKPADPVPTPPAV